MSEVGIIAYGTSPFTKEDHKIESMLHKSTNDLFKKNPDINKNEIDAVLVSTNNNSKYLSPILSEMAGIQPKIAHSIESLCNSGTNSIVSAFSYISSGLADMVLVSGAERYDSPGQILEWDNSRGEFKHPIFWASIFSKSYKQKYDISDEELAVVSVKNHKQASKNPNALSKKTYTVEDVMNSKKLTDDLKLLDCSRPCTGSASILLASEEIMKKYTDAVHEFHTAFGLGIKNEPTADLGVAKNLLRFNLMKEENEEYLEAANANDLVEVADALGDMLYILAGTIIEHGMQYKIAEVFDEIQRSNMSKLGEDGHPIFREDGKVLKGPNYFKPNIGEILEK